jgi:hypothetical protein
VRRPFVAVGRIPFREPPCRTGQVGEGCCPALDAAIIIGCSQRGFKYRAHLVRRLGADFRIFGGLESTPFAVSALVAAAP